LAWSATAVPAAGVTAVSADADAVIVRLPARAAAAAIEVAAHLTFPVLCISILLLFFHAGDVFDGFADDSGVSIARVAPFG
jgi:hypothetical protein